MDLIAVTGLVILLKLDSNRQFFGLYDLEIWCMTLKNNRTPLLWNIKLCVSFQSHLWSQIVVTVRKYPIRVKIGVFFLSPMTLKFDRWPWKTIGHLCYATSSFVHHFIAIGEFTLELRVQKCSIWAKIGNFLSHMTLKLEKMTLTNNRALFLYHFKLCASFQFIAFNDFKLELHSGDTQFGSKSLMILSHVTLKLDGWPRKTIGHLFYATASFVHYFLAMCEYKLELRSGNAQTGAKFILTSVISTFDLRRWPLSWPSLLSMVITPEDFIMIWWQEHWEKGMTDGRKCS